MSTIDDAPADDGTSGSGIFSAGPTIVLACGLATTVVTLVFVYWLGSRFEALQIMGWYASRIIPIGACMVGMLAGSGYGLGCWWTGQQVRTSFVVIVGALQLWAYFVAQYQEYKLNTAELPPQLTPAFTEYFDVTTRSFAFQEHMDEPNKPLGIWGYGVRLLEILGFVGGGVFIPFLVKDEPYCDKCARYMRRRTLSHLPAGVVPRKIKKKDVVGQEAYDEENHVAMEQGRQIVARLKEHVEANRADLIASEFAQHAASQKLIAKQSSRFRVQLVRCPSCASGSLRVSLFSGHGNGLQETELVHWDADPELIAKLHA